MSFFSKGDFSIKNSWQDKPKQPQRPSSRQKKQSLLANAAKNHMNVFENPPSHEILDDDMSRRILKQFQSEKNMDPIVAPKSVGKNTPTPTPKLPPKGKNQDIVTSMAARLSKLEMTCASQRSELKEKNDMIEKLKNQNELLRKNTADPNTVLKQVEDVKKENEELKGKVEEMEKFLKNYGLKWVGNKIQGKMDKDKLKKDLEKPKYNYRLPSEIDIRTVAMRIQELNMGMHSEGNSATEVYKDKDGIHKIRKAEPLPVGFFADGIAIGGYPFFPYKSKESLQVLADILDGYFPFILKTKYPNGTFLKVVDKTEVKYADSLEGDRIGGLDQAEDKKLRPPSKEEFLDKLPKQIIQNGKVIQIRGEIEKRLDGVKKANKQGEGYQQDADGTLVFKTQAQIQLDQGKIKEDDLCTLKIRTQSGRICILRLLITSKMKQVYTWMRKVADKKDFVVIGNYPKRQYEENESQNLEELGLAPNSALHLQSTQYKQ